MVVFVGQDYWLTTRESTRESSSGRQMLNIPEAVAIGQITMCVSSN